MQKPIMQKQSKKQGEWHSESQCKELDDLVSRFFSRPESDWSSPDGQAVQVEIWIYLWDKAIRTANSKLSVADREDLAMQAFHKIRAHFARGGGLKNKSLRGLLAFCRTTHHHNQTDLFRRRQRQKTKVFSELVAHRGAEGENMPIEQMFPDQLGTGPEISADHQLEKAETRAMLLERIEQLRLKDPRKARLIELDLAEVDSRDMAAELGVSMSNLYQLRKRSVAHLASI